MIHWFFERRGPLRLSPADIVTLVISMTAVFISLCATGAP